MKRYTTHSLLALVALASTGFAVRAIADDFYCPPNPGPVTIDGNVIVENGVCRLIGTEVKGNVHVYSGGSLVTSGAFIDGNIQAEGGGFVRVREGTDVAGDIQLDNLGGADTSIVRDSTIGGSIQMNSNAGRLVVRDNTVDSDVQAFSNMGGVVIRGNVIDGNLQCKSNWPAPVGGGNQVSGNKEDQCAKL